jgi:hypothetical protein
VLEHELPSGVLTNRVSVNVPLRVLWEDAGREVRADGHTQEVSGDGGLILMTTPPPAGAQVELVNDASGESVRAWVVRVQKQKSGPASAVTVELLVPNDAFWGVTFRLKKASNDLSALERAIRQGELDARALREFRDAVDHIRKTAWVVQEWCERTSQGKEAQTVLTLLTLERIRRATQLNSDLAAELSLMEPASLTSGIEPLLASVGRLQEILSVIIQKKPLLKRK